MISAQDLVAIERSLIALTLSAARRPGETHAHATLRAIGEVHAVLTAPLHSWLTDRDARLASLALDAIAESKIACDLTAVAEYLSGLDFATTIDRLGGKITQEPDSVPYESSVLASLGGYSGLTGLVIAPVAGLQTIAGRAGTIAAARVAREASQCLQEAARKLKRASTHAEVAEAVESASNRLLGALALVDRKQGTIVDHLTSGVDRAVAGAAQRASGASATWGLRSLDDLCPLRPGGVYVLAASPGAGKTSLAMQSAAATCGILSGDTEARRGDVAIVSLEMAGGDLALALAARQLRLPSSKVRDGASDLPWDEIRALAAQWSDEGSMLVRDSSDLAQGSTIEAIGSWLRGAAAKGVRLAVIDYLQLLDGSNPRWTEYQRISHSTREAKKLAQAVGVPILLLSQLSRAGRDAVRDKKTGKVAAQVEPTLSDLRGSGSIEQDADAVLFLHKTSPDEEQPATVRAILAKHRWGPQGEAGLIFYGKWQRFETDKRPKTDETTEQQQARAERITAAPAQTEDLF